MTKEKIKEEQEKLDLPSLEEAVDLMGREQPFQESTEVGQVFENLDRDNVNEEGMSNIDFNARLHPWEANACMVIDEFRSKGILPADANITRMKKRLSVSLGGLGRQEKVQVATASRGADMAGRSGGIMGAIADWFKPKENQ